MRKERKKTSPVWQISEEKFKKIVLESSTYREMLKKLNLGYLSGENYKTLQSRISKEKIDTSFLKSRRTEIIRKNLKSKRTPLKNILVENSNFCRQTLKKRLFEEGILEEKCSECGISKEWNGKPLVLQLEHKNGVNNDNRLENLCILCPNCHTQTKTFAGRKRKIKYKCNKCFKNITRSSKLKICSSCFNKSNRKVENRPSKEELLNLILNMSFVEIGKKYNVSDNAVRKWCVVENLPRTLKEIKNYKEETFI
jgi:hypothetical protein